MPHAQPIRVAIVAASRRILGGHAVQAERLLTAWRTDPAVDAWLVPINPLPPLLLRWTVRVAGLRTLVTQLCYWPLLVRELRRADVVHVFSASYSSFLLAPLPAVFVARLLGKPLVLNYHSGEAPDHLARSALARYVLSRVVQLNVVPSRFLQEVFAAFAIPAVVVPNTIDLHRFAYRERRALRPRLVSTRNFEPLYNLECTLRAFARIQARHPDASLTLVGAGSQDERLRALVSELRLQHVRFVGRVAPEQMPTFYADADIYIQTPSIDNMPLSVLEAFASGLPVVSTAVGGVPTMLRDGVHGLLAPDNDAAAVAERVEHLLANPQRAREMAAAARATCDDYAWATVRGQWLAAYKAALAEDAGARVAIEA